MGLIFCNNCGRQLDESFNPPNAERIPCPDCGSTSRRFEESCVAGVRLSVSHSMQHKRKGKTIGFESGRQGRTESARQDKDNELSYALTGNSPQGEEDTLLACRILVNKLNEKGGNWQQPTLGDGVIDCQAVDRRNKQRKLNIQIVHADVDPELWKTLSLEGKIERGETAKVLADRIKSAIDAKANNRRIPEVSRQGLGLALDATRLPAFGFDVVVGDFRSRYGSLVNKLGFDSIWLVGPTEDLTWRLDKRS
jgi:hypothetical protein